MRRKVVVSGPVSGPTVEVYIDDGGRVVADEHRQPVGRKPTVRLYATLDPFGSRRIAQKRPRRAMQQ